MRVLTVLVAAAVAAAAGPSRAAEPADRLAAQAAVPGTADDGTIRIGSAEEAVALALRRSPTLRAAEAAVLASRGELVQAGLPPNPEFQLTGEDFAGSGQYRGARALEATAGLSQRLEVGGQRAARVGVAARDVTLAGRDPAAARLDLIRNVRVAFAQALAARRAVAIEEERLRIAEEFQRATRERVRGGRETPARELRAGVALSTATIARERAVREAVVARRALAVLLAAQDGELVARADAWFGDIGRRPAGHARPDASRAVRTNPDVARLEDTVARARAALELERRRAIPDVAVSGGVRRYRETSDTAFVLGVSVPLPVFDRNQGKIARASADLTRTELASRQARRALGAALADANERLEAAWREADSLRRTVLPAAEQAFRFARAGYAEGRFSFLEVLDAQRTLFDARAQLNDALRDFHTRRAEADRLSGGPAAAVARAESTGGRR